MLVKITLRLYFMQNNFNPPEGENIVKCQRVLKIDIGLALISVSVALGLSLLICKML